MLQLVAGNLQVRGNVIENPGKRSQPKSMVTRNGHMMLFRRCDSQAHVAPCLTGDRVANATEPSGKIIAGDIARQSQTAMTCSRVKCSRTTRGISSFSK